tara:strand:- start:548 stop:1093 length:546 start_codon:yes stop_codon:yes gene_type:complete
MSERIDIEDYIAKCALGDRDAFGQLYSATSAKLFGVCLRVLGNRAEAEDALQDVFVKIWRDADRYQVNGLSPMTWLITVARNLSIDKLRARKTTQGAGLDEAEDLPSAAPGPETLAIAASDRVQIVTCMAELEPDRSDAVRRAYLEGETYQELADRYGVPLNTVRTWLRRSLIKLKECLSR